MEIPKVFESEYRFCRILWENEPVKSSDLVRLCQEQLGWKPTTTYTVLRRLGDRGVLKNENTVVRGGEDLRRLPARLCGRLHPQPQALPGGGGRGSGHDRPVPGGGAP